MSGLSLPDALSRLAELIPERVRLEWNETDPAAVWLVGVKAKSSGPGWQEVWWGGDFPRLTQPWVLEYALREEIEARGWMWRVYRYPLAAPPYGADIEKRMLSRGFLIGADTPAHALALALIAALEAE